MKSWDELNNELVNLYKEWARQLNKDNNRQVFQPLLCVNPR